ncbi:PTS transporter subunit IIC [Collinsella ureilytica]|nr:PTS transporter subunit IIC [Collinsella urealyticum]
MGWAPSLGLCWSWKYAFLMFPVQIGINVIMLLLGWTKTLNVDMWNVGNQIFTAFLVSTVTGNAIIGFAVAVVQIIAELKNSDHIKNQITELTGVPGIGMPHPMFLSNIIFYPIAQLLDKILPESGKIDAAALKKKIGIFGENHILGFIIGFIIGLMGGQGMGALMTGVQAGCALTLFPMVSKLFMTALTPISDAANSFIKKRFPGREMVIGLDWPILAGNPEIWVSIILTIPVALLVSIVLPGNFVLPFGNLMNVCVCAAAFVGCKGDMRKMLIISYIMVPILCWSATDFAPMLNDLAVQTGGAVPDGQMLAWWGMDIAEIRWAVVEAMRINPVAIAACIGIVALAIFYYFPAQRREEHAAAVRMGWIKENSDLDQTQLNAKSAS